MNTFVVHRSPHLIWDFAGFFSEDVFRDVYVITRRNGLINVVTTELVIEEVSLHPGPG